MILGLFFILFLFVFGGHLGYMLIYGIFHPINLIIQILILVLLFKLGSALIQRYVASKPS